jgi:hypothetical protein
MSMSAHHRRLLFKKWARLLHLYISMFGLLTVLFFAVTGFMLNHEEWFGFAEPRLTELEGDLPVALLEEPDQLAIVERLRKDFQATGALDSFDIDEDQLNLVFRSPGRRTEALISRSDGHAEVTLETHGFAGRLVELHRGTEAGPGWRLVIDISAILMLVISMTGLILWLLVPRWRPLGLAGLAVCALACALVYFVFVP